MAAAYSHPSTAPLRILLVGSGGREHALAWRLEQSPLVEQIFVAPGNGGTALGAKSTNLDIAAGDFAALAAFATSSKVNLVIPGPEQPLVDGIELIFRSIGIPVFGPSQQAAAMEGSKAFSKDFMRRHDIPTARHETFTSFEAARSYILAHPNQRVVIKASGLADGKGVLLPIDAAEIVAGLENMMVKRAFGSAADEVVIEDFLDGEELSVLAFCDGYTILPLPAAQDHKAIGDGDTGPNTGGMGAYAPAPLAKSELDEVIMRTVLRPTIDGMRRDGFPFVGLLFTGLIVGRDGVPRVLEYNVRFGDPETQALMALLSPETDLAAVILAAVERRLDSVTLASRPGAAISVVLASQGYPGKYPTGLPITFGPVPDGVTVFHAGTIAKNGKILTAGGRVITVVAHGLTLERAVELAYDGVKSVQFEGMVFRRDIAHRALKRAKLDAPAGLTYAAAGVNVDAGNALVERIKPFVRATRRSGTDADLGGFGGLFDLKAAGYQDPILVSGTDGVGTKLKIAQAIGVHDTIGIDLVAMSVNDLIVQGAEPLYFLDYFACGKLDVAMAADAVKGVAAGCTDAGCALIGGETAEMPSLYAGADYDLAGFAVGAVERKALLPRRDIAADDVLLGLASSGVHSNGFSLVRKILETVGLSYGAPCPWDQSATSVGHALLMPTAIYVRQLLAVLRGAGASRVKALCHITGGGFTENLPRVLPRALGAEIDVTGWALPPVFRWLMRSGRVAPLEMCRTFNCGIGMVVVVAAADADALAADLAAVAGGAAVHRVGRLVNGTGVRMVGLESWAA